MAQRTAFFISDGTGITAETLGTSLLSQFDAVQFKRITMPYVDTPEKAEQASARITQAAQEDEGRPIVIDTIVNRSLRDIISRTDAFMVDVFGMYLNPLEQELNTHCSLSVGKTHSIDNNTNYKVRIDAVHFSLDNDDGAGLRHYDEADIILVGVSRSGKTPTCLYLALQFGIKAANYPITEDDIDDLNLPKVLRPHKHKIFGLSIDYERLAAIRSERKPESRYASMHQCEMEVRNVEAMFNRQGIPYINSTHASIEEISTRIIENAGLARRTS